MLAVISDTGIIVLVGVFVLLFGAGQLPKMARHLAEAGKEFRKAHAELSDHTELSDHADGISHLRK